MPRLMCLHVHTYTDTHTSVVLHDTRHVYSTYRYIEMISIQINLWMCRNDILGTDFVLESVCMVAKGGRYIEMINI